ncbi:hypothetical protein FDP41_004653 [Naegleria fowleri]|uniref:Uncharacterized protein n=1 Tax=Naegleria fowleri TaxID=5763 RepID=A0A6A5BHF7_NAEFO|nr:uncharacterized protein FDP41_004653 [Naegleria fowleri]KAF0976347.1 hypothetical protein FDP41_004653 [Naegleria fowleri]CAG4714540.1 unnamed protein product [Naegleria fowleri]
MSRTTSESKDEMNNHVWINAWYDPLATVTAMSQCMMFCDINGDGDYKLVAATSGKNPLESKKTKQTHRLRVYKGTGIISENILLEEPVAIASYYTDYQSPKRPMILVASTNKLFLYKNLQPFFKFCIPSKKIDEKEAEIWQFLSEGKYDSKTAFSELARLRDLNVALSPRSYELLSLTSNDDIRQFIDSRKNTPIDFPNNITCLSILPKDREGEDAIGCPVIGTESGIVFILSPSGSQIIKAVQLPSAPVKLCIAGNLDNDYRIAAACRNGNVYTIKNGEVSGVVIELESHPVTMVRIDKTFVIGLMNSTIHCFNTRGKKQYSIYLPAPIKDMEVLDMRGQRSVKCVMVALENKELRIYNGKSLVNTINLYEHVVGLKYGTYGSEVNSLMISYRSGGLDFKVISRKASLESKTKSGPPPEQEEPLDLPTKTFLYLEQTKREVDYSSEMHNAFQKDLARVRLNTARAYVKILTDGQGPLSYTSGSSIRLVANVQGLGPKFKVNIEVQNTGKKPISNLFIIFAYDEDIYSLEDDARRLNLPSLLPGPLYRFSKMVNMLDPSIAPDTLRLFVCSKEGTSPVITAVVNMPMAEMVELM